MKEIKVVVIDDSAVIHALLNRIFGDTSDIRIIGNARNGIQGIEMVKLHSPDVIIMDITMPGMSGLEAIEKIMEDKPTPIIVFSAASKTIINLSFKAIDMGAVEIIEKPEVESITELQRIINQKLVKSIRTFADLKVIRRIRKSTFERIQKKRDNLSNISIRYKKRKAEPKSEYKPIDKDIIPATDNNFLVVGIASSTGGPQTVKHLLSEISCKDAPCSYILVQHMAMGFLNGFCKWINEESCIPVEIAVNGACVQPKKIYIAPEGYHLTVNENRQFVYNDDPPIIGIKPSADILFKSLAAVFKQRMIAVILTGMGRDGASGIRDVKNNGGYVIAQDEASSYIFGMPKAAIETGLTDKIVSIYEMPNFLERLYHERYTVY